MPARPSMVIWTDMGLVRMLFTKISLIFSFFLWSQPHWFTYISLKELFCEPENKICEQQNNTHFNCYNPSLQGGTTAKMYQNVRKAAVQIDKKYTIGPQALSIIQQRILFEKSLLMPLLLCYILNLAEKINVNKILASPYLASLMKGMNFKYNKTIADKSFIHSESLFKLEGICSHFQYNLSTAWSTSNSSP